VEYAVAGRLRIKTVSAPGNADEQHLSRRSPVPRPPATTRAPGKIAAAKRTGTRDDC
jgi:hypothetical protein